MGSSSRPEGYFLRGGRAGAKVCERHLYCILRSSCYEEDVPENVKALSGPLPASAGRALRPFGGEDEGHLRGALARFAAHRDLRAAVWMIPNLALLLGHGFRGTTVEASETLFPRDTLQPAVL
jgi:hypothetical protein